MEIRFAAIIIVALIIMVWISSSLIFNNGKDENNQKESDVNIQGIIQGYVETGWFLGEKGQSCDETCEAQGKNCEQDGVDWHNWKKEALIQYFDQAGIECKRMKTDCDRELADHHKKNGLAPYCQQWGAPYMHTSHVNVKYTECQISTNSRGAASCSTKFGGHHRLCYCKKKSDYPSGYFRRDVYGFG